MPLSDLDQIHRTIMLEYHLQYNHYPAVPLAFVTTAEEALEAAALEDWERLILLPTGIQKSAASIIEELHLRDFLDMQDATEDEAEDGEG